MLQSENVNVDRTCEGGCNEIQLSKGNASDVHSQQVGQPIFNSGQITDGHTMQSVVGDGGLIGDTVTEGTSVPAIMDYFRQ